MFDGRATGTNALHAMLMAALVVAAAFVVGVVAFDLEGSVLPSDPPPDASFRFVHDPATDTLVVTHYGGDNLDADRVRVVDRAFEPIGNFSTGGDVSAGESATLANVTETDTVYVLWVTDDGDYRTLASWNDDDSANSTDDAPDGTTTAARTVRTTRRTERPRTPPAPPGTPSTATFLLRIE